MTIAAVAKAAAPRVSILGSVSGDMAEILTPQALAFVGALEERFGERRRELLAARVVRQEAFDRGEKPDFLPQTKEIRDNDWVVGSIPADLQDRRVEITGPVDRKMVINALNSGAKLFMADFEDSHCPTWEATIHGQINLRDAIAGVIEYTSPEGKQYALGPKPAVLIARPRGWHLEENHVLLEGRPVSGGLFDFGLYFFHNHAALKAKGSGPYFYLPKLENHQEAKLWDDVFRFAQEYVGAPVGTIKATVLVEVITASFELHEILYALREHIVALNCGRWDYIFSYIKKMRNHPDVLVPDRGKVTMTSHFLRSYSRLVIQTCHRRRAMAMGGMSAFIPVKGDEEANTKAFEQVRADKLREVTDGHDGTWVAHPGLVPVAMEIFDQHMPGANQLSRQLHDLVVTAEDLVRVPEGTITEAGVRNNCAVALRYMAAWLDGLGCVPIFNLMEDAATAEISRSQLWQWLHRPQAKLEDGRAISAKWVQGILQEEAERYRAESTHPKIDAAKALLESLVFTDEFTDFLTLPAYEQLES